MPETSTPISETWELTDSLASRIVAALCRKAPPNGMPDNFVIRDSIFGIDLVYERVIIRSQVIPNAPIEYRYALYTKSWVLEMTHRPSEPPKRVEELQTLWLGRGDKDRWMKDATLIKLSGV